MATGKRFRSFDFYFPQTDDHLYNAWIDEDHCFDYFRDRLRALAYVRFDCPSTRISLIHRGQVIDSDERFRNIHTSPGEELIVLSDVEDVDPSAVLELLSRNIDLKTATYALRYTCNDVDEAMDLLSWTTNPRCAREKLMRDPKSLCMVAKALDVYCRDRKATKVFLKSLLLDPKQFRDELLTLGLQFVFQFLAELSDESSDESSDDSCSSTGLWAFDCLMNCFRISNNEVEQCGLEDEMQDYNLRLFQPIMSYVFQTFFPALRQFIQSIPVMDYQLLRRMADQGQTTYVYMYCLLCTSGLHAPLNWDEVLHYWKILADHGDPNGQLFYIVVGCQVARVSNTGRQRKLQKEIIRYCTMLFREGSDPESQDYLMMMLLHPDKLFPNILQGASESPDEEDNERARIWKEFSHDNPELAAFADQMSSHLEGMIQSLVTHFQTFENPPMIQAIENDNVYDVLKIFADMGSPQLKHFFALGASKDLHEAVEYLKSSSSDGYGRSTLCLAILSELDPQTDLSDKASNWKKAADETLNAAAIAQYGVCLLMGRGVPKNEATAARYLRNAAFMDEPSAQSNYGLLLLNGTGAERNPGQAARYFKKAADQGHAAGQNNYGTCLLHGIGVEKDEVEAVRYFKLAADQGEKNAQCSYGVCLLEGCGIESNPEAAVSYLKTAADHGLAPAQYRYGKCLLEGTGTEQHIVEGTRYLKAAADAGYSHAQIDYGRCLNEGVGTEKNPVEAARYFKMAGDQECAQSNEPNHEAEFSVSVPDLKKAAEQSTLSLMSHRAKDILDGKHLVAGQDSAEAVYWLKMAADGGEPLAQFEYSLCLLEGKGTERNCEEACQYMKKSADNGNTDGMCRYGCALLEGEFGHKDVVAGMQYLKRSADMGNKIGQYSYARYALGQDGCDKDEALTYLLDSYQAGYGPAIEYFHELYPDADYP